MDSLALSFSQCFIHSLFIYVYFWKWLCWARTHKLSTTVLPPRLLFVVAVVLVFGLFKFLFCFSFGGFVCFVFCFETWSPEVAQSCLSLRPHSHLCPHFLSSGSTGTRMQQPFGGNFFFP